ncbi:MAG: DUF4013 domain-containing protein [Methanobrevibacter sp.]|uniref:DUF4013 domain-containing protein n=1 Tax=Methanobrevibacter millerae TaxID=230361 RepID=A0A8T3VFS2_9EURY|nr:DUF4013 domain-containing protein [Methanobrevibacter sp.]MBE6510324.1 DUF4013 domain-containing protein [Methanobrevibacter millerae]MBO5151317.1 DUF4013 domain-containing protein [Methanobrevibacter sp.]
MNLREIITDAIKYPISDTRKFLIFCVLIILMSLSIVLPSYGLKNSTLAIILTLVTLIVLLVVLGYSIEVIKSGLEGDDTLPDFDYVKQFVIGVKAVILDIIYFIIPAVITIIVASATGLFSSFTQIVYVGIDSLANETTNVTTIIAAVPKSTMNTFTNALSVTLIVAIILFFIFSLMSFSAQVRFAKFGSGTEGLRFKEIIKDMLSIGIIKIIVTLIVIYIIALALVFVITLIGLIPYIGVFIGIFVGVPFILLFLYRAIGLLYADAY